MVCIEGNIGSGKTSLSRRLSIHRNTQFIGEEFEENPFLPLFYQNAPKYAFALEFSFLVDRVRQMDRVVKSDDHFLSDYYIRKSIWFASVNLQNGQYAEYAALFPDVTAHLPEPQALIFLHLPVDLLIKNINIRGRKYEQEMKHEYLEMLNKTYLEQGKLPRPETSVLNFHLHSNRPDVYDRVFESVNYFLDKELTTNPQQREFFFD